MSRRDHDAPAAPAHDQHAAWDDDWGASERPRKGLVRRVFGLLRIAMFVTPLAVFGYGFIADCRTRPSFTDWTGFIGAGACARSEILGNAASMPGTLAILRRLID